MKKYQKTKFSGLKWVGNVPNDWMIKRLKFTTSFDNSTVDRHTSDDEIKVRICHYPQVYKNEIIYSKTEMENGTCTKKELDKFRLKKDDILITKDSETADEIGVPVYIQENFENTVSGYHIAHLTTNKNEILGSFLFRYLQSDIANGYFETEANGVTRFGLGKDSISNLKLILPSIAEQEKISQFLDRETMKIDSDIHKNQKLIELLKEKRQSTIYEAVTKGLDHSVPIRDSGIDWIGDIPKHWKVFRLKFLVNITTGEKNTVDNEEEGEYPFFVRSQNIEKLLTYSYDEEAVLTAGDGVGVGKVFHYINGKFDFHQRVYKMNNFKKILGKYFYYYFKENFSKEIFKGTAKSTVDSIRLHMIQNFPVVFGTIIEQEEIVQFLEKRTEKIDSLISKVEIQIEQLQELRQTLISSAVTGKIDLRGAVA